MPRTIFENMVIQKFVDKTSIGFCQYTAIRFFEILFIEKGNGKLNINGHNITYGDNQIFVFIPNDKYNFEIETPTTVTAIKFLNNFFTNFSTDDDVVQQKEWFKKIETILYSTNRVNNIKLSSDTERNSLLALFTVIFNEFTNNELKNELILKATLQSILHIISRNVNHEVLQSESSKIQQIINYIHYNIHDAALISNQAIASEFNISKNYIGQFFKKQMGMSIKKYILNHKLKLAETRLKYTDYTLSEIALELGFTDSSHLDKTFISYKGVTASNYKLQLK
ncbi:AraC family transcriptional regulator [Tenacibaculum sp. 190524A05c]|uniref:helix-turn-helix domain-containing protein n=1 Tax=Tenacibaculum platacis TaxID=3137852 RepID=UPI0031FB3965